MCPFCVLGRSTVSVASLISAAVKVALPSINGNQSTPFRGDVMPGGRSSFGLGLGLGLGVMPGGRSSFGLGVDSLGLGVHQDHMQGDDSLGLGVHQDYTRN